VKINRLHGWQVTIAEALAIQRELAARVSRIGKAVSASFIGGVDVSVRKEEGRATGAAVILSYPELSLVEARVVEGKLDFPYVPGLLSYREIPLVLQACEMLTVAPDLVLVDGQGIAHPRRVGLASHLGLFLDVPTIGCAKSLLCGSHEPLGEEAGSHMEVVDIGETIGAALRTRTGVKPVYISTGHMIELGNAIEWALRCCKGYRLPEPVRLAHHAAGRNLPHGFKDNKVLNMA
jgi:deoxyribonuclease V